jgi:hypothetical protein
MSSELVSLALDSSVALVHVLVESGHLMISPTEQRHLESSLLRIIFPAMVLTLQIYRQMRMDPSTN